MAEVEIIKASVAEQKILQENDTLKKKVCAYCRVSTDNEEQQTSYVSQIKHYTSYIKQNPDWKFVGIYADEGLTGTQIKHRDNFIRMIEDCKKKKIDIIIAKSISRFARNTVDTLNTVRFLRDLNIDVYFEKENIHTLTMDSEMFLTLYSAFAQAESESTSMNVKMGYQAKMKRGEPCGKIGCYGFYYDTLTKELSINEEEAKIVRKIFEYYINGMGTTRIANKLTEENIKSPAGKSKWHPSPIKDIIRNEKYVGDICGQKFFITSPLTHKQKRNRGQKPKYYSKNHHEAIIDRETWDKAQEIYNKRSLKIKDGKMYCEKFSRRYNYSSKIECGYCHHNYVRRYTSYTNKLGDTNSYTYWVCSSTIKNDQCIKRVSIREEEFNSMFVSLFNKLNDNYNTDALEKKIRSILNMNNNENELKRVLAKEENLKEKLSKLLDMKLENQISDELYNSKTNEISKELDENFKIISELNNQKNSQEIQEERIKPILKELDKHKKLDKFDNEIFEKFVKKIIVGGVEAENGEYYPNLVRFVLNVDVPISTKNFSQNILSLESEKGLY